MSKKNTYKNIILRNVILSFPRLVEPESFRGGPEKYKGTFVVPDAAQQKKLAKLVAEIGKEHFGEKFAARLRKGKYHNPLHKTDSEDNPGYPEDSIFIRASSSDQPGLVAIWADPKTGKAAALPASHFYAGAIVNVSVACSTFEMETGSGLTFYLNNIQFVKDGPRLDGRVAAEDEFEVDENAQAPLEDLDDDDEEEEEEVAAEDGSEISDILNDSDDDDDDDDE